MSRRLDVGGTEKHITRILPQLRRHGIDVSLFVLERGGKLESTLASSGINIAGPGPAMSSLKRILRAGWQLYNHLRHHRPDIVHFFLPEPYLIGSLASMLAGIDVRIMSRRSLAHYQVRHPVLTKLEVWLHRHTSALLANSHAVLNELVNECGDRSKVALIYNGIDVAAPGNLELRMRLRGDLGIPADCFVLVIIANLIAYKGHADLFQALALANELLPKDWRLLIVGRDDGAGIVLRKQAASLGLQDHFIWLGERPDAEHLFSVADVAVLASHEEGFSNSLIEAMGQGVAVIATAVGGNLDAVVPGESGLLVPTRDPTALAAAITRLALDKEFRSQLGEAGRQRAEKQFSLDACIGGYVNLYRGGRHFGEVPVSAIIDGTFVPGQ